MSMLEPTDDSRLILHRLHNQCLVNRQFPNPVAAVAHFGAVQAQDYRGSLWALGLRTRTAVEATIEQAIADRGILRTWPLRGTIHFVVPADARWMLDLSAARVIKGSAGRWRQLGLDEATFAQSRPAVIRALEGGRRLERHALYAALEAAGISTEGQRGIHILGRLALEALICIGPRQGNQPTFVLLDEWIPPGRALSRDVALAELARRYFVSHGPATPADFIWWSGLAPAEARAGMAMVRAELHQDTIGGRELWFGEQAVLPSVESPLAHLLPVYDEYAVAYKDRSDFLSAEFAVRPDAGNGIFRPPIVIDGQIVGTWTRKLKKGEVSIHPKLFRMLNDTEHAALAAAAARYDDFLGRSTHLALEG